MNSAEQFLNALILNPRADQIWVEVEVAFKKANRQDLIDLCKNKDAELFRNHFKLIESEKLPNKSLEGLK